MLFSLPYKRSNCHSVIWVLTTVLVLTFRETLAIAVAEVRLLSDSSRSEYILHGEGATLTCYYLLEPNERVTEVEWEKDDELVYLWTLDEAPKAFGVLQSFVDTRQKSPGTLVITKAHINMQGSYRCKVRTNGKTAENEAYVMIIADACHDDGWKTHTDMITCTETVSMHCIGIYPKPSPNCGVYSESTGKFLNSIPFDSVNILHNNTYEVSFNRRFVIHDWRNYSDVSFNCHMVVMGTPWRSGVRHKMFGDPGCAERPPDIANGYYNMTDEKSCWGNPIEGATVEYHCNEDLELIGSPLMVCRDGAWTVEGIVIDDYAIPTCGRGSFLKSLSPLMTALWTLLLMMLMR